MGQHDQAPDPEPYRGFATIPIDVAVRIGTVRCRVRRLLELRPGDLLVLDRPVGAPFDLVADGCELGRVQPLADEDHVSVKVVELAGGAGGD